MSQSVENEVRECVECGTRTDRWTYGWDGKYRCVKDAPLGPPPTPVAHHCRTCRCPVTPATQRRRSVQRERISA